MKKIISLVLLFALISFAQERAVIRQENTQFRQGPGSYYPLIGILVKEAIVTILSETSGWVKIRAESREGWISKNALSQRDRENSGIRDNSLIQSSRPMLISKASVSGAVKGFAQTYLQGREGDLNFLDQWDSQFFTPAEYRQFLSETYRGRDREKIGRRYRRIKIENPDPAINSYLEKMGFAVAAQIAGQGLEHDVKKLKYVNMVGNLVVENTPLYYHSFKFYILADSRPVAYAAPNGMIFVSRGLLDIIRNEAELACVLGHEISHVVQQHGYAEIMKRSTQIAAEDAFEELAAESPAEFSDSELEQMAFQMFEAATSRRQTAYELEADMLGVIYAYKAGYDPSGLPAVLNRIRTMTDRDFWHPESNWQYDSIEGRVDHVNAFITDKLTKKSQWNVTNSSRFANYMR